MKKYNEELLRPELERLLLKQARLTIGSPDHRSANKYEILPELIALANRHAENVLEEKLNGFIEKSSDNGFGTVDADGVFESVIGELNVLRGQSRETVDTTASKMSDEEQLDKILFKAQPRAATVHSAPILSPEEAKQSILEWHQQELELASDRALRRGFMAAASHFVKADNLYDTLNELREISIANKKEGK